MQNTHLSTRVRRLHGALLDIASVMNRPQRDEQLLKAAGLTLERALFPLLVSVARYGPIGIVELADRIGRDYTTVSRQIARLEQLGLITRQSNVHDRRVREAVITNKGRGLTELIDAARESMAAKIFAEWTEVDLDQMVDLVRRLADAMVGLPADIADDASQKTGG